MGGGIGFYIAFLLTILIYINFISVSGYQNYKTISHGLLLGSGGIVLVGLLDDLYEFSPILKLSGQVIFAILTVIFGIKTQLIYISSFFNSLLTIIWLVAVINAFNLLDIADGLSTGIALITSTVFFILACYTGNTLVICCSLILIGSLAAFLIFNFPPATIYLGDTGSMCIGYILGVIAINISYAPRHHEFALIAPILILGLPLYDMGFVALRRIFINPKLLSLLPVPWEEERQWKEKKNFWGKE